MLEIRRYRASDQDEVWALHILGLQQAGAYLGNGPWDADLHNIEEVYLDNRGEFLVGMHEGRIIAMGGLRRTSDDRAEIKRMRVHPDFQRQGLGQILLEELEAMALVLGYTWLHLDTSVVQATAQKLYLKNGFQETGREVHRGLECILFEKRIR